MKNDENGATKRIPDVPQASENTLLALAIATAVISAIGAFVAWVYVFGAPEWFYEKVSDVGTRGDRARAVTPFLAAGAAVVTFFSVLWRGAINSRQAYEQKRQNDGKEEADLALLYQSAVKLLEDTENKSASVATNMLGLSMLATVANSENGRYATFALEGIVDQFPHILSTIGNDRDRLFKVAVFGLVKAKTEHNRRPISEIILDLSGLGPGHKVLDLRNSFLHSLNTVTIRGAILSDSDLYPSRSKRFFDWRFIECSFSHIGFTPARQIEIDNRFDGCAFANCHIGRIKEDPFLFGESFKPMVFDSCDLSGCHVNDPETLNHAEFKNCYFYLDNTPYVGNFDDEALSDFIADNNLEIEVRNPAD